MGGGLGSVDRRTPQPISPRIPNTLVEPPSSGAGLLGTFEEDGDPAAAGIFFSANFIA